MSIRERVDAGIRNRLEEAGDPIPDQVIDTVLDNADLDQTVQEHRDQLTVEPWDRQSPINGVPADQVLEDRDDIPDQGTPYLIRDDATGRVVVFQPHRPHAPGHEPVEDPAGEGNAHAQELAEGRALATLVSELTAEVRSQTP